MHLDDSPNQIESSLKSTVNENFCCLCKEASLEEETYLLGFMTFTNGNGWLGMDPTKNKIPLFDSCGHLLHISCQQKMRHKNDASRVYFYCPLCKNPANILIPEK